MTAQDELREALAQWLPFVDLDRAYEVADGLLAGPLAGLVAERDTLRAAVARVEALIDKYDDLYHDETVVADFRAALGGEPGGTT